MDLVDHQHHARLELCRIAHRRDSLMRRQPYIHLGLLNELADRNTSLHWFLAIANQNLERKIQSAPEPLRPNLIEGIRMHEAELVRLSASNYEKNIYANFKIPSLL